MSKRRYERLTGTWRKNLAPRFAACGEQRVNPVLRRVKCTNCADKLLKYRYSKLVKRIKTKIRFSFKNWPATSSITVISSSLILLSIFGSFQLLRKIIISPSVSISVPVSVRSRPVYKCDYIASDHNEVEQRGAKKKIERGSKIKHFLFAKIEILQKEPCSYCINFSWLILACKSLEVNRMHHI